MSTRTVIEINHDFIGDLQRDPSILAEMLRKLACGEIGGMIARADRSENPRVRPHSVGLRFLAQRHHSETLNLKVE